MAYEHNIFIPQGSDWTANVIIYTSNTTGRFVVDTSAYANGAGQLRKCLSSNAAANLAITLPADAAVNGVVTLTMNNMVTSSIPDGRYLYDVEVITTDDGPTPGVIIQVVRGTITIHPSVTRTWDWGS